MLSSMVTVVRSSWVGASRHRSIAFIQPPIAVPVHESSRSGETTAKVDLMDAPRIFHRKRASGLMSPSSVTWASDRHLGQSRRSLNTCHTVATGASMVMETPVAYLSWPRTR